MKKEKIVINMDKGLIRYISATEGIDIFVVNWDLEQDIDPSPEDLLDGTVYNYKADYSGRDEVALNLRSARKQRDETHQRLIDWMEQEGIKG